MNGCLGIRVGIESDWKWIWGFFLEWWKCPQIKLWWWLHNLLKFIETWFIAQACISWWTYFCNFKLYYPLSQRRRWHPTPVLLPGESHGWRSLVAAVHGVSKSRTRLSDFPFNFHFHALEKGMAIHSSVLAWRSPGIGEPGGLPSMEESDMTEAT